VSTTVAPPRSDGGRTAVPKRRRWWPIVVVVLIALGLLAVGIWQFAARSYRPRLEASYFGYGPGPREGNALLYRSGASFRIRFNVTNRSGQTITITRLRVPDLEDDLISFVTARMYAREGTNVGKLVAFRREVLSPKETRFFVVRMRFDRCRTDRLTDILVLGSPTLKVRYLGVERWMELKLLGRVRLLIPPNCPQRP
jgi:hypothetical protein